MSLSDVWNNIETGWLQPISGFYTDPATSVSNALTPANNTLETTTSGIMSNTLSGIYKAFAPIIWVGISLLVIIFLFLWLSRGRK